MLSKSQVEKIRGESSTEDKTLSLIFNALSDPGRLRIFKVLLEHPDVCVSDIANILNVSVPAASMQLKILEASDLIEKVRKGQTTCFKIDKKAIKAKLVIDVLKKVGA